MLIAFEGIDGSGKTTHSKILYDRLLRRGLKVHLTAEPTQGPIGKLVRRVLSGELSISDKGLALLFAADRVEHNLKEICPKIDEGHIVITDRYLLSSLAYQGLKLPLNWVSQINRWARVPDVVIYLDVGPEVAIRRLKEGAKFHSLETLRMVRENYIRLLQESPWREISHRVNAEASIDSVSTEIIKIIDDMLGEGRN